MVTTKQIDVIIKAQDLMTGVVNKVKKSFDGLAAKNKQAADAIALNNKVFTRQEKFVRDNIRTIDQFATRVLPRAVRSTSTLSQQLDKASRKFQGWAMSIMFAGMAMMRYTQQIWSIATKTFQDVMHSVDGTTTSVDMLNGHLKYLQFVAGEALAPLAEQLIPIIVMVAQWIQDNEELFRSFVKWGFIIGTLFFTVGQLALAFNGVWEAASKLGILFSKGGVFTKLGAFLATPAGAGVLALVALGAITWKALKETPEALESVKTSIKNIDINPLKDALGNIWESMTGLSSTWENVAWVIAWGVDVAARRLQILVDVFAILGNSLATIFNLAKAAWAAVFGSPTEKKEAIEDLNNSLQAIGTNFKSLIKDSVEAFTPISLEKFKQNALYEQLAASNPSLQSREPMSYATSEQYMSREPTMVINIENFNNTSNSSEEIFQSFERIVQGG